MPLRDDLLIPIPGENPSGANLRYEPVYDQIKEARREEAEVAQGEWQREIKKADWVLVTKLAGEALAKKSKDLQIAAWLTEAMLRREGFAGLHAGLDLLRQLLENFWDTLYPELEDGDSELRATPLDWIGSRLDEAVKNVPLTRGGLDWFKYKESRSVPYEADAAENEQKQQARNTAIEEGKLTPEEFDNDLAGTPRAAYEEWMASLDASLASLDELSRVCEEKFGDYAPGLGGLKKTLEEVRQAVHILLAKKRQQEPGADDAVEETAEPAAAELAVAAAAPARAPVKAAKRTAAGEPADREDAIERVAVAARYLRQQDASNPASYLLLRGLRWGELRGYGEGYDPDPALLEPPPTETRQALKRLAGEGEWQQVLDIAEDSMAAPCGRAWLDLQRYAVNACENLGYHPAAWAIKCELRALVNDLPNLIELTLADDTPVANPETRAWLREFAAPAAQAAEQYYAAPAVREEKAGEEEFGTEAGPDAFDLALEAVRSGHIQEAIEILTREIAQESSGRGRFQRKVQLAQICLGAGLTAIAFPVLDGLARDIEARKLDEWEAPDTIAHALGLLFRCMEKMEVSQEEKQKIYARICRLDPVQALAISK